MSKNFEAERDAGLRATILSRVSESCAAGEILETISIPDRLWAEFVAFVGDLDQERRVRRWVRDEWARIQTERQEECPHERARIIDASTGLLRCDNCAATFTYADMEARAPTPEQLEKEKAEAAATITRLAGGPSKS